MLQNQHLKDAADVYFGHATETDGLARGALNGMKTVFKLTGDAEMADYVKKLIAQLP